MTPSAIVERIESDLTILSRWLLDQGRHKAARLTLEAIDSLDGRWADDEDDSPRGQPRRIPRCWTEDEMRALLGATSRMEPMVCGVPISLWFRAFVMVCFDTGERTGAMLALEWQHFNPSTGELEAPAEIRKGRMKGMLYNLKPATVAAVEAIREPKRVLIFPWEGHETTFYKCYKRLLKHAGLPYERQRSGPQKIRRTFASHIEAAGGNATAALDHTARKVTVNSYLDPRIVQAPSPNVVLFDLDPQQNGDAPMPPELASCDPPGWADVS